MKWLVCVDPFWPHPKREPILWSEDVNPWSGPGAVRNLALKQKSKSAIWASSSLSENGSWGGLGQIWSCPVQILHPLFLFSDLKAAFLQGVILPGLVIIMCQWQIPQILSMNTWVYFTDSGHMTFSLKHWSSFLSSPRYDDANQQGEKQTASFACSHLRKRHGKTSLLLESSKGDSRYTFNYPLKPVVNFRIYTVEMMFITRCSFITFIYRMMGSNTIKIILAAKINEHLLCVRHCSKPFKSHSPQPYKIVYRWKNRLREDK